MKSVNYADINLVGEDTYGVGHGLALDKDCDNIETFKAIVVSYETLDGDTWENPYYEVFRALYEGRKLN